MSFNVGHTTFGFTMRVPETEAAIRHDSLIIAYNDLEPTNAKLPKQLILEPVTVERMDQAKKRLLKVRTARIAAEEEARMVAEEEARMAAEAEARFAAEEEARIAAEEEARIAAEEA